MKFAGHLDTMMQDRSIAERLQFFAEVGLPAYELWCWWDYELSELRKDADRLGLVPSAVCTRFISLVDPSCRDAYLAGLEETVAACSQLGTKVIISQVGDEREGVSREEQKAVLIEGLRRSASLLAGTDLVLCIEPLNLLVDHAGYYLSRSDEAAEIVRAVNSPNVRMLFDIYHQQITEGNLIPNIRQYADLIGHYHLADHPGRHEPGTGEINYLNVLDAIRATDYQGFVGLEYWPSVNNHEAVLQRVVSDYA